MTKQTIREYLDLHYRGDASRVEFLRLDHSRVRTVPQLVAWVCSTFRLDTQPGKPLTDPTECLYLLFHTLGERKQHYILLESYPRHMSEEVRGVLDGNPDWRSVLGFHLWRDHLVQVAFFQDPETKGKQPPSNPCT